MDQRIRSLAEQLDGGMISRREFLRRAAAITGGTAAGLTVLGRMAHAQARPKMRVWLFKSFVTDCNDILAKHIEAWAKERKVEIEFDWATFGDREQKFVAAIEAGRFKAEIVPVEVPGKGGPTLVQTDEGPRKDTSIEALGKLKPAFQKDGTVTAGNAPGLNDGASALVVSSMAFARTHGIKPIARITSYATGGGEGVKLWPVRQLLAGC